MNIVLPPDGVPDVKWNKVCPFNMNFHTSEVGGWLYSSNLEYEIKVNVWWYCRRLSALISLFRLGEKVPYSLAPSNALYEAMCDFESTYTF